MLKKTKENKISNPRVIALPVMKMHVFTNQSIRVTKSPTLHASKQLIGSRTANN